MHMLCVRVRACARAQVNAAGLLPLEPGALLYTHGKYPDDAKVRLCVCARA